MSNELAAQRPGGFISEREKVLKRLKFKSSCIIQLHRKLFLNTLILYKNYFSYPASEKKHYLLKKKTAFTKKSLYANIFHIIQHRQAIVHCL